jgi:terminase large subunit-like protein
MAREAEWVRRKLGFKPDAMQSRVLEAHTRRGLLNCCRQWGKSTLGAAMAVHQAYTKPESLTLVISPSARQSGEFVRKAARFLEKLGVQPKGDGDNEMSLLLPNRSRIVGLPSNEVTVRGFSAVSLMIIDEAARVSDEMYHALRPMLAASRGRLWLMSTPHGKRGFFYEAWKLGGRGCLRITVPATECRRISRSFLREEQSILGEHDFRQEYMCEFEDAMGHVFDRSLVEQAITQDIEPMVLG